MNFEARPRFRVLLSPGLPRENQLPKAAAGRGLGAIDVSGFVKRIRTHKSIRQPNGTFELGLVFKSLGDIVTELKHEKRTLNLLTVPQNLCEIELDGGRKGQKMTSVMQGVVTRVFERPAIDEHGTPQREVVIAGQDWGNILVNHDLPAHYFSARIQSEEETKRLLRESVLLNGPPKIVCQKLFDAVFTKRIPSLMLKTNQVYAIDIDRSLEDPAQAGVIWQANVWERQGKFWTALRSLADEPFNELYADWLPEYEPQGPADGLAVIEPAEGTKNRKFVIRLRRRPTDERRWNALPTHEIRDEELRYHEAALCDDERLNWISVAPLSMLRAVGEQNVAFIDRMYSRIDLDDGEAHGARHRRFESPYGNLPKGASTMLDTPEDQEAVAQGTGPLADLYNRRADFMWNTYGINHRLRRATWVCPLRPEIKVGHRARNQRETSSYFVKEENERRVGYIEDIVHDVLDGHHAWTHMALTRVQPLDGFIKPHVDGRAQQRGNQPQEGAGS